MVSILGVSIIGVSIIGVSIIVVSILGVFILGVSIITILGVSIIAILGVSIIAILGVSILTLAIFRATIIFGRLIIRLGPVDNRRKAGNLLGCRCRAVSCNVRRRVLGCRLSGRRGFLSGRTRACGRIRAFRWARGYPKPGCRACPFCPFCP